MKASVISKVCSRCYLLKERGSFYECSKSRDGLQGYCIECAKTARKQYREDNKSREIERALTYRANNRHIAVETSRRWAKKNPEKAREVGKATLARGRANLGDSYVKELLVQSGTLPKAQIPQSLIKVKRAQVLLLRAARELTKVISSIKEKS